MKLSEDTGLYTDYYELTMAQAHLLSNRHQKRACFDYFFRSLPFGGGFVTFAGLSSVLEMITGFRYTKEDCDFLRAAGFSDVFLQYLSGFSFKGSIWSVREGEIIFPNEPVLRVEGSIMEAQLIETVLLNFLNFESLIATKASRMRLAAGNRTLLEFGLRRAHGLGGIHATKAAICGGFDKTSNVYSARLLGVEGSGTMAHSWIQSFADELQAFRTYARWYPDNCVLLADTYNTLESGIPNAITVAGELRQKGHQLKAVRLDSGDFTYLSKKTRKMLDDAGFPEVKIVVSNQLDEIIIKSLLDQGAPIDIFGVGTSLVTGNPDAALDGVYKLSWLDGQPTMKVSDNLAKMTLPGIKTIHRFLNSAGEFQADGISFTSEQQYNALYHPVESRKYRLDKGLSKETLMTQVMENGKITANSVSPAETASYNRERLARLPEEYKRFLNPPVYISGITSAVLTVRNQLARQFLKKDLF